ncbi:MAG: hypothetical protein HKN35_10590 [Woeseia sp.]|nr:hypothetical protein [Woeseia sp.]
MPLVALLLVYALTQAARNGLADVYARPATNFLQDKRDADDVLTDAERQVIISNLGKALKLAPGNPVTLTELGRVHRIKLEIEDLDTAEVERHGNAALDYYQQAARLRPAWPWGWRAMARVRYELYEDDSAAYHEALVLATQFGPWENSVQREVAELGVDTWESLNPAAKLAVASMIERGLLRQPAAIEDIMDFDEYWQAVCFDTTLDIAASQSSVATNRFPRLHQRCAAFATAQAQELT